MIIVSSCLVGMTCRYDGKVKSYPGVQSYLKDKNFIAVCPEQMGGLATPRDPAEIQSFMPLKIVSNQGLDVTAFFERGVHDIVKLMENYDIELAILKSLSPSCGSQMIYDGSFKRKRIEGEGIFCKQLRALNVKVVNEITFESK